MKTKNSLFTSLFVIILIAVSCKGPDGKNPSDDQNFINNGGLILPDGFTSLVVAESLGRARHITVRDNGDIYLALRQLENDKGIVALRDSNGDGAADEIEYFGEYAGTGIDIHKGFLYFASDQEVMRYKLIDGQLLPDQNRELIVTGFPDQNQHEVKPFTFDGNGNIYVNVGAPSNACMEQMRTAGSKGLFPCPQLERQAGIWRFRDDVPGQDQVKDGYRYATGIRNSVALDWNFNSDHLYVVQHGRDQLYQFFPDLFDEDAGVNLPAEELFLVNDGSDFGWPYCYFDPFLKKKVLAPEYGGDGETSEGCEDKEDPIMDFPAHAAPNDILFYSGNQFPERYKNGAFIAFHGSWNRAPQEQEGYYVVFIPFEGAYPSAEWEIFADGFAGKDVVMQPHEAEHRPMGLAQGPDGSLYVSDSQSGKIWKIQYHE